MQCAEPQDKDGPEEKEQSNGQTNQVKSKHFNHNHKYRKTCIEAKVSTISFYNSINIRYKLDTDQSKNYIPLHLYKRLFPKVNNTYIRPKICQVKLRYNEKERICKFVVVQNGSTAALGMWDIDRLGMLSINLNSKRQVTVAEDNQDNCENQRQTKKDKWEQLKGKLQETETQNTQDANGNPMVTGNNNKESITFCQLLIADTDKKDDMTTIDIQTNYSNINPFSEVLNNQNLITGTEIKEDEATIGAQIDCNNVDFLTDSLISYNSPIIEEETKDTAAQNTTTNNNNN